jgi:4,5-DOPA dioxygenase extradiol
MSAIEYDEYARSLQTLGMRIASARALLIFSAHWISMDETIRITASEQPDQLYDFSGFPEDLYQLERPFEGNTQLAREVASGLQDQGWKVELDSERGFDHGVWAPLGWALPNTLPSKPKVIQLSLPYRLARKRFLQLGRDLAPLRAQGIVIAGSGNLVHNLTEVSWESKYAPVPKWARSFEQEIMSRIAERDFEGLCELPRQSAEYRRAQPTDEHLLPLLPVLGSLDPVEDVLESVYTRFHYGSIAMRTLLFSGSFRGRA